MVQITRRTDALLEMMIVRLSGDFDLGAVASVRSAFHEVVADGWSTVLVDLEEVSFIDSAGLGILIGLARRCRENGGTCVLLGVQDGVARLLEVTGLDGLFPSAESAEAAAVLVTGQASAPTP